MTEQATEQRQGQTAVNGLEVSDVDPRTVEANDLQEELESVLMVLEVDPDYIESDPEIKAIREWTGSTVHERAIPELAATILAEGQRVPCIVRVTESGTYGMVDGERRKAAVQLLRSQGHDIGLQVAVHELNDQQAMRIALLSFTQHEPLTPMQFAKVLKRLRVMYKWVGQKGTEELAKFVGKKPATVTQMEKLLTLPKEVQEGLETGRWTPTTALELTSTPTDLRATVADRATEIAAEEGGKRKRGGGGGVKAQEPQEEPADSQTEQTVTPAVDAATGPRTRKKADLEGKVNTGEDGQPTETPTEAPAEVKVQGRHVRKAQEEIEGANPKPKAPRMAQAIELFETWDGPGYAAVMQKFAAAFCQWGHGKLETEWLTAAWDDLADSLAGATEQPAKGRKGGRK